MGSDLISYILVGPVEIKNTPKTQARAMKSAMAAILKMTKDDDAFGFLEMTTKQLKEVIQGFVNFWNNPDTRDANVREVSLGKVTYKILVVGDSTWGDTPDGLGFQTCEQAEFLDILKVFKIQ
jgi:hypothetical protein